MLTLVLLHLADLSARHSQGYAALAVQAVIVLHAASMPAAIQHMLPYQSALQCKA